MIKSFLEFVNENVDSNEKFIKSLTLKLIQKIKSLSSDPDEYVTLKGMEFREPYQFDLILNVRKEKGAKVVNDEHFKNLEWEQINYDQLGYSIEASVRTNSGDLLSPEIIIHLIIDPSKEPHLYNKLHARLLDILTHETNHIDQFSIFSRDPFSSPPSSQSDRKSAKKNYRYFLLVDEIESMVEGMYASSKQQNLPLDEVFFNYLEPFIKSGYISKNEFLKVFTTWIKFALERYPDALFSKKVEKIVNSI